MGSADSSPAWLLGGIRIFAPFLVKHTGIDGQQLRRAQVLHHHVLELVVNGVNGVHFACGIELRDSRRRFPWRWQNPPWSDTFRYSARNCPSALAQRVPALFADGDRSAISCEEFSCDEHAIARRITLVLNAPQRLRSPGQAPPPGSFFRPPLEQRMRRGFHARRGRTQHAQNFARRRAARQTRLPARAAASPRRRTSSPG